MLHCALFVGYLSGAGTSQAPQGQGPQQDDVGQHPDNPDYPDDENHTTHMNPGTDFTIISPTRPTVETKDKCSETSPTLTRSISLQTNTCPCFLRHRDIFNQILNHSTRPEVERLEQLKQFLIIETQIAPDNTQTISFLASQAIDFALGQDFGTKSRFISRNLLQCVAYVCYSFKESAMVKHLIRAYEKLADKQSVVGDNDCAAGISWLLWFPLANRSTVLYSMRDRQNWPQILSFILSASSNCLVTSVVHYNKPSPVAVLSKYLYPLIEVPIPFADKMYTPLGLACLQRRLSVCLLLLQHGARPIIANTASASSHHQQERNNNTTQQQQQISALDQPLNIVARDFNQLAIISGQEEEQYRTFSILKYLMKVTSRVRVRFVENIALSDCHKCVMFGSTGGAKTGVAKTNGVVLLDTLYKPMIAQWAAMYDGVDSLRQMCRNVVRGCLARNHCLPEGVNLLPITTDIKEVIMLIK